jgi:hypothetical protein
MPDGLSSNTGQATKSESVAISASYSDLSTTCWPRKTRYCARGIPSAGRRVVFAQLRKCSKVYDWEILSMGHFCFPKAAARSSR